MAIEIEKNKDRIAAGHRLALELECLLLDTQDLPTVSRWWDSGIEALDEWQKAVSIQRAEDRRLMTANAKVSGAGRRPMDCRLGIWRQTWNEFLATRSMTAKNVHYRCDASEQWPGE